VEMTQHIVAFAKRAAAGFPLGILTDRVGKLATAPGRALIGVGDCPADGSNRLMDAVNSGGNILLARSQGGDDKHQFVVTTALAHSSSCGDAPLVEACGVAQ